MRFWAIEARPGELLLDEAPVDKAVTRIAGITTVEALFVFTSRMALDLFMEGGFLPEEGSASRQELEAAFERELRMAGSRVIMRVRSSGKRMERRDRHHANGRDNHHIPR